MSDIIPEGCYAMKKNDDVKKEDKSKPKDSALVYSSRLIISLYTVLPSIISVYVYAQSVLGKKIEDSFWMNAE